MRESGGLLLGFGIVVRIITVRKLFFVIFGTFLVGKEHYPICAKILD